MLKCKQCGGAAFMLDGGICEDCDRINEWEGSNVPTVPGRLSKRPVIHYSDISHERLTPLVIAVIKGNEKRAQA